MNPTELLKPYREKIDQADQIIVSAIESRFDAVVHVGKIKKEQGMDIFDPKREEVVLDQISTLVKNQEYIPYIRTIYQSIMDQAKAYQKDME